MPDVDAVVDAGRAERGDSQLLVVCCTIAIRLAIDKEVDIARLGHGSLQPGERGRQRSSLVSTVIYVS